MNVEDEKRHAFCKTEPDWCVLNPNPLKEKKQKCKWSVGFVQGNGLLYIWFIFQQKYLKFKWIFMQNYSLNKLLWNNDNAVNLCQLAKQNWHGWTSAIRMERPTTLVTSWLTMLSVWASGDIDLWNSFLLEKEILYTEGGEALERCGQRSYGCPISGNDVMLLWIKMSLSKSDL